MSVREWVLALALLTTSLSGAMSARAQENAGLAQTRYERGLALLEDGNPSDALVELRASYELAPSPNSLLLSARALRTLGRLAEAHSEFRRAMVEAVDLARSAPRYRPTAEAARLEMVELEPRLAFVTVLMDEPPEGVRVQVGERSLPVAGFGVPIAVDLGEVVIGAEADGYRGVERTVDLVAGQSRVVVLRLESLPVAPPPEVLVLAADDEPPAPDRAAAVLGWSAVALGLASVVPFVTFYQLASDRFTALMVCQVTGCANRIELIAGGRSFELWTNAFLGLAIGFSSLGVVLLSVALGDSGSLSVAALPRGAALTGRF